MNKIWKHYLIDFTKNTNNIVSSLDKYFDPALDKFIYNKGRQINCVKSFNT